MLVGHGGEVLFGRGCHVLFLGAGDVLFIGGGRDVLFVGGGFNVLFVGGGFNVLFVGGFDVLFIGGGFEAVCHVSGCHQMKQLFCTLSAAYLSMGVWHHALMALKTRFCPARNIDFAEEMTSFASHRLEVFT
jgi:hypothetical protein